MLFCCLDYYYVLKLKRVKCANYFTIPIAYKLFILFAYKKGWEDAPLAPEGKVEARKAGQLLKAHGFEFDVVYTVSRKRETCTHMTVYLYKTIEACRTKSMSHD
jgi:hypothetical protein